MKHLRLRIWLIVTFTLAVTALVIRCFWQIAVIPAPATILVFLPIIVALLGTEAIAIYLTLRPEKIKSLPAAVILSVAGTAGATAVVAHYARFIASPEAEPILSKLIASLLTAATVSFYFLIIYLVWWLRRAK
jgi:purine-cytosine permease-like protein